MSFIDDIGDTVKETVQPITDGASRLVAEAYDKLSPTAGMAVKGIESCASGVTKMFGEVDLFDSALEAGKLLAVTNPAIGIGSLVAEALKPEQAGAREVSNGAVGSGLDANSGSIIFVGGRTERAAQEMSIPQEQASSVGNANERALNPQPLPPHPDKINSVVGQSRRHSNVERATRFV